MTDLVLTFIGDDRAGLVASVSKVVEQHGGSWQRSALSRLAGKFAGVVLVSVPASGVAALEGELAALADHGLDVTITHSRDTATPAHTWTVSLLGQDRTGVVAEISTALARHGVGIESLQSDVRDAPMSGGTLFEASIVISVPDHVAEADVRGELERLGDELLVDIDLDTEPDAEPTDS
ncbi:glycine cleavage system transcriptional repressor [Jatrophihabitans fulvus]